MSPPAALLQNRKNLIKLAAAKGGEIDRKVPCGMWTGGPAQGSVCFKCFHMPEWGHGESHWRA